MNETRATDITTSTQYDPDLRPPHHRILSLNVTGGFLDGTRLQFSDGLNCIIGGRGTGKTTVLEFIRYILGMMPDAADGRPRPKAIEGHVRGNLGSGTIQLEVETKHGTRYRAERPWGDDIQVLDSNGDPVPVTNRAIPPTNNGSERALRPCVTFRKITNGFRTEWGARLYADIRSVIETGRRRGIGALEAVRLTLAGSPLQCPA